MKVGRLGCGECFEGEGGDFEGDALFDGEPMKSAEGWGDVITSLIVWKDNASKRVLDGLEAVEGGIWEIIEEGIAVV
jgi:hypothetical protein